MWSFRQCILLFWIMVGLGAGLSEAMGAEEAKTSEPPDVIETPELFISATKTETPIKHVTSAVEIITGEQMQQRRMKTVVEALRLAQGLAVFQSGGPGTLAQVRMRGGTPQQTLVLIDGAIVNSATDGTYNFANLTTDNIERIEILRGSQGMMWGSDAMGGVVNIITKRGRETPNISAFAEYGSFATLREGASVTGKKGLFDVAATLSRWDTSNFSAINYRRGAAEWICRRTDAWSSIFGGWMGSQIWTGPRSIRSPLDLIRPMCSEPRHTAKNMCIPGAICSRSPNGGRRG
jgi:outer membrane cobalamin receptor